MVFSSRLLFTPFDVPSTYGERKYSPTFQVSLYSLEEVK